VDSEIIVFFSKRSLEKEKKIEMNASKIYNPSGKVAERAKNRPTHESDISEYMQISSYHTNSALTVETVGITPKVPASQRVSNVEINRLWVDDDDVVQFSDLVVARGPSE